MKERSRKEGKTSLKLLVSAGVVFAEKGYRDTTVAEICERAGTNIASVNYHFGSKEALYREAWLHAFRGSIIAHPADGGVPVEAPPEERLRGYITATLQRAVSENNVDFFIMNKEMAQPTGLLDIVAHEAIMPLLRMMESIVAELIGPVADEEQVRFCGMSILNQCLHPVIMHMAHKKHENKQLGPPEIVDMGLFADHVYRFSLAGILTYRRQQA